MYKGTIIGCRPFSGEKNGKSWSAVELCIRRTKEDMSPGFSGQQVDSFAAFADALGSYSPQPGDGVTYHLYGPPRSRMCGYILPNPDFDE